MQIDELYNKLLNEHQSFLFINDNLVLTKERSIIKVDNKKKFLDDFNNDIYYKTIINNEKNNINKKDLELYHKYINKYKDKLTKTKYNDKYYFGCIAVKTKNGFITTIRGKENLNDYTLVSSVDHNNHIINVINKKATLNAPLLDHLFKNNNVKVIVHLHEFDNNLPYYDYHFPGTVKDSIRNNITSFNIKYHGVIYLINKKGEII